MSETVYDGSVTEGLHSPDGSVREQSGLTSGELERSRVANALKSATFMTHGLAGPTSPAGSIVPAIEMGTSCAIEKCGCRIARQQVLSRLMLERPLHDSAGVAMQDALQQFHPNGE